MEDGCRGPADEGGSQPANATRFDLHSWWGRSPEALGSESSSHWSNRSEPQGEVGGEKNLQKLIWVQQTGS